MKRRKYFAGDLNYILERSRIRFPRRRQVGKLRSKEVTSMGISPGDLGERTSV